VRRQVKQYSLDALISVGCRVNSKRGTQFRIWATRTLLEHLLRGYTLNERRLAERGLKEMEQAVALRARTLGSRNPSYRTRATFAPVVQASPSPRAGSVARLTRLPPTSLQPRRF
jgi:hypothetical protein